jgi:hypothetical protein
MEHLNSNRLVDTPTAARCIAALLAFVVALSRGFDAMGGDGEPTPKPPQFTWETFYQFSAETQSFQVLSASQAKEISTNHAKTNAGRSLPGLRPIFRAVRSEGWFKGLVPIYSVELENRTELRRLPGRGQENLSNPVFHLLPNADEPPEVLQISGRWEVNAIRSDKSPAAFAWEIAADGTGKIAGRFEQLTDYRFAHLIPGTFQKGQIKLGVEYIQQKFDVTGEWSSNRLLGTWHEEDLADRGTWQANRTFNETPPLNEADTVPLYEWVRTTDSARVYQPKPGPNSPEWIQSPRSLGRVWRLVLDSK